MGEHTDVLIVGAGPAGSIAALMLARAGARVRLIDRAQFPREKLCGDTLNPGALARLEHVGVADGVRSQSLPVRGMIVTGPRGTQVTGDYGHGIAGAALPRSTLDLTLLEAATRAGAQFDSGVVASEPIIAARGLRLEGVRAGTGGVARALRARAVIAADGRHSRLAFMLGLSRYAKRPRRWAFGAYYAGVEGLTAYGEMHIRSDGYVGVAALPGGLTNVCVVCELGSAWRTPSADGDEIVRLAIDRDPALRDRFARAQRTTPVAVLGPLAVEARAAGIPGLLLAGDAAGFIDPMTGDGLRFAIRGAELAAQYALRELETGRAMHDELHTARRREFAGKWRMNRILRRLVASPHSVSAAARVASVWQAPFRQLISFAGDVNTIGSGLRADGLDRIRALSREP